MKRHGSSDSLGVLMSICPNSTDEQGNNLMYTRDFQTMMDGYDEENCMDQESCRSSSEKKRRLSVDQVKALEKNFEVENKLEPERKVKLAQELGLQPRQVAVWFQNRRARWKTKQLERDYGLLKANYDGLKLNFEKLQHDNEALMKEIRELKSKVNEDDCNNSDSGKDDEELMSDTEEKIIKLENSHLHLLHKLKPNSENIQIGEAEMISGEPSVFVDFKDGSSDSDSSAILNEDIINNNNNNGSGEIIINNNINSFESQESSKTLFTGKNILGHHHHLHHHHHEQQQHEHQFVKIEEHNFFGEESCSTFFSDDQAPSLHWYEWNN
ncbi:hypothetical protein OROGR_006126 [Orobanche gracilis]